MPVMVFGVIGVLLMYTPKVGGGTEKVEKKKVEGNRRRQGRCNMCF